MYKSMSRTNIIACAFSQRISRFYIIGYEEPQCETHRLRWKETEVEDERASLPESMGVQITAENAAYVLRKAESVEDR